MNEFNLNFYKGKKVLVTGHTGFKGTWLCRILQELGAEVTGYSQKPPTDPSIFTLTDLESQIHSVIGDIRDLEHMIQVFKETQPEIVFHLAAQPIVRESYKNPVYTYETNVMGTVNVLEAVRQCGSVRSFLNVTTAAQIVTALTEITCTTTLIQALLNNTNSLFFCCILNQYTFYFHNHHFPSLFQLHYK